ncbi:cupredoxin domain-containing protein [Hydrogenimonas sp.]
MKRLMTLAAAAVFAVTLQAADHVVVQKDKAFHPNHIKAKVGDRIIFKNDDGFAHNAFSDSEIAEFDIGMQKPGQDVVVEMKKPGKVEVECAIHPNMHLTIEVEK